jgi:hypothetical protein
VRGTILRVQVERIPARTRPPKVLSAYTFTCRLAYGFTCRSG